MVQISLKLAECLGNNIKTLRERAGLSLSDLAEATGLSKQSIWNFENGERFPSSEALAAIALFFKLEETDLANPEMIQKITKDKK